MKTNKCVIGFLILTAVFVQSCKKGGMWGIKGQGENITEVRNVSDFDKIQLSTDADIEYVQDSIYKLEVNAQKNILAVLETKVVANELIIDFKRNVWEHHKIGIIIHSPNMHKINLSGSGVMTIKNKINSPSLDVTISGSGNLSINSMTVQSFSSNISGSGGITITEGTCNSISCTNSGSGFVNAEYFYATNADAKISGSGFVTLNVSNRLNATISGSGTLRYRGSAVVNQQISGSGRIIHLD